MSQIRQQTEQIFPAKRLFIFDHYQTPAKSADFFPAKRLHFFIIIGSQKTLKAQFFPPKDLVYFDHQFLSKAQFFPPNYSIHFEAQKIWNTTFRPLLKARITFQSKSTC